MKVRQGFVSNSSSSSFVCDLTGEVSEGYDASLTDFEMVSCVKGHTFFYSGFPEVAEWVNSEENEECNYDMPKALCPICNGKAKPQLVERIKGMMKDYKLTVDDLK